MTSLPIVATATDGTALKAVFCFIFKRPGIVGFLLRRTQQSAQTPIIGRMSLKDIRACQARSSVFSVSWRQSLGNICLIYMSKLHRRRYPRGQASKADSPLVLTTCPRLEPDYITGFEKSPSHDGHVDFAVLRQFPKTSLMTVSLFNLYFFLQCYQPCEQSLIGNQRAYR
jgi:hypothetical protein